MSRFIVREFKQIIFQFSRFVECEEPADLEDLARINTLISTLEEADDIKECQDLINIFLKAKEFCFV